MNVFTSEQYPFVCFGIQSLTGWAPSDCTLSVTDHVMKTSNHINKARALRRTPGRRCQVCYWCIIKDSLNWLRNHLWRPNDPRG